MDESRTRSRNHDRSRRQAEIPVAVACRPGPALFGFGTRRTPPGPLPFWQVSQQIESLGAIVSAACLFFSPTYLGPNVGPFHPCIRKAKVGFVSPKLEELSHGQ